MKFDFDAWWIANVGTKDNLMDIVYKKITMDAIEAALKHYKVYDLIKEKEAEEDLLDCSDIDLSDVL
jgi:hypothetical protein